MVVVGGGGGGGGGVCVCVSVCMCVCVRVLRKSYVRGDRKTLAQAFGANCL